jgi:hypothetical protein
VQSEKKADSDKFRSIWSAICTPVIPTNPKGDFCVCASRTFSFMDLAPILERPELLSSLLDASTFLEQFPATLYRFFQVHGKEERLVRFIIALEFDNGKRYSCAIALPLTIQGKADGSDAFVSLFSAIFFNQLGVRYLSKLLSPLLEKTSNSRLGVVGGSYPHVSLLHRSCFSVSQKKLLTARATKT